MSEVRSPLGPCRVCLVSGASWNCGCKGVPSGTDSRPVGGASSSRGALAMATACFSLCRDGAGPWGFILPWVPSPKCWVLCLQWTGWEGAAWRGCEQPGG